MKGTLQISDFIKEGAPMFGNMIIRGNERSDIFNEAATAKIIDAGGLLFCTEGRAEFVLNERPFTISRNDIVVAFPGDVLQCVGKTDDFVSYVMGVNTEVISELNIPRAAEQYLMIKEDPCRHLTDRDVEMMVDIYRIVDRLSSYKELPNADAMVRQIITSICYGIAGLYLINSPLKESKSSRQEVLFRKFLYLLNNNNEIHRDVAFYADSMCISTKYLSTVVKGCSGRTPIDFIEQTVVSKIKLLLTTSDMTIQQIAYKFDFANPSFFSQYFKRITGQTPSLYRKNQNR